MTGIFDTAGSMLRLKRRALRAVTGRGGAIVGVSEWMTERARTALAAAGIEGTSVQCISNYVDLLGTEFKPNEMLADLRSRGLVLLLVAAHLESRAKGAGVVLEALSEIRDKRFTLVTVGPTLPVALLESLGLAQNTVQIGAQRDRAALAGIYAGASLTLVPSLAESFSLVAGESIACGTPVMASNVAALPELVRPGVSGWLVSPASVNDWRLGIEAAQKMPLSEMQAMRESTREFGTRHLQSYAKWTEDYIEVYRQAAARHIQTRAVCLAGVPHGAVADRSRSGRD